MTAHRFRELKANPALLLSEEQSAFARLLDWEKRSNAAKRAVQTKRARYAAWPCHRKKKS